MNNTLISTISSLVGPAPAEPFVAICKPALARELKTPIPHLLLLGDFKPSRIAPLLGARARANQLPLPGRSLHGLLVSRELGRKGDDMLAMVGGWHTLLIDDGLLLIVHRQGSLLHRSPPPEALTAALLNVGFRQIGQRSCGSLTLTHGRCLRC